MRKENTSCYSRHQCVLRSRGFDVRIAKYMSKNFAFKSDFNIQRVCALRVCHCNVIFLFAS